VGETFIDSSVTLTRKSNNSGNDELKHKGRNIEDAHPHTSNGAEVQNTQQFINV